MPDKQIQIVDFCKPGFNINRKVSLQTPLDTVEPLGLASLGCQPVLSHRTTPNEVVMSRVKHDSGVSTKSLLTSGNDAAPRDWPYYSAYIASFRDVNPVAGTVTSPFPATDVTYQFDWTVQGLDAYREANPVSSPRFSFAPVGFGAPRPYPFLHLGGGETYDASGLGFRRAYHSYQQQLLIGYCPSIPLTLVHDAAVPETRWPNGGLEAGGFLFSLDDPPPPATPTTRYFVQLLLWEVNPAITVFSGTTVSPAILNPLTLEYQPIPGETRTWAYLDYGELTMPGYGGNVDATYVVDNVRPWLVMYATGNVDSITLNGIGGSPFSGSAPTARIPPLTGNPFGLANTVAAPVALQWSLSPLTTSFDFTMTVSGKAINPAAPFTTGDPAVPRYYEGLCAAYVVPL